MHNDIKFTATMADIDMPANFDPAGTAWIVKLTRIVDGKRRQFSTPYFTGSMVGEPNLDDVLETMYADWDIIGEYSDAIAFAQDFGYDNMREATDIFNAVRRQTNRFSKFISS